MSQEQKVRTKRQLPTWACWIIATVIVLLVIVVAS